MPSKRLRRIPWGGGLAAHLSLFLSFIHSFTHSFSRGLQPRLQAGVAAAKQGVSWESWCPRTHRLEAWRALSTQRSCP